MGLGGLVLGGALQGIGAGLAQQGQQQAQAAAASAQQDAAMRREIALENLRAQNTATRDKTLSAQRMDEQENAGRVADWQAGRQTARTTDSTIKIKGVDTASQIQIDKAKTANDAKLAQLQSGLRMTEDQAKIASETIAQQTRAGHEVGDTKVRKDGALVVYSKTGAILSVSKPGLFRDPEDKGDMGGIGAFPGAPAVPASAPANRPPLSSFEK